MKKNAPLIFPSTQKHKKKLTVFSQIGGVFLRFDKFYPILFDDLFDQQTKKILENEEIKKIMTIIGLQIGEKVSCSDLPEGDWLEIEIDGIVHIVNENDEIFVGGRWVEVKTL